MRVENGPPLSLGRPVRRPPQLQAVLPVPVVYLRGRPVLLPDDGPVRRGLPRRSENEPGRGVSKRGETIPELIFPLPRQLFLTRHDPAGGRRVPGPDHRTLALARSAHLLHMDVNNQHRVRGAHDNQPLLSGREGGRAADVPGALEQTAQCRVNDRGGTESGRRGGTDLESAVKCGDKDEVVHLLLLFFVVHQDAMFI